MVNVLEKVTEVGGSGGAEEACKIMKKIKINYKTKVNNIFNSLVEQVCSNHEHYRKIIYFGDHHCLVFFLRGRTVLKNILTNTVFTQ
jgi:hypothetical protein